MMLGGKTAGAAAGSWLTASSSQSLSSAQAAAALHGSQEARLAVLYSSCPTDPIRPLLKVATEAALLLGRRAAGLRLPVISSGSAAVLLGKVCWGCAGPAGDSMRCRNRPPAAVPWLRGLLLMSAGPDVSSLGAGKAKGAVLRLMPHSLSTGVAAEGPGTEGLLRLNSAGEGSAGAGPRRPPVGSISKGDFIKAAAA